MRIIDKNHDYYDYLQDPTDTVVFDRRGSFLLEKSHICNKIIIRERINKQCCFIRLQCGATFWIFLLTVTKFEKDFSLLIEIEKPVNYDLELIATWKNYDKPNKLLDINLAEIGSNFLSYDRVTKTYEFKRDKVTPENAIAYFDFCEFVNIGTLITTIETKNGYKCKKYTIPLLHATGIANIVPAIDMFCAIEEYFSIEKSLTERTEAIGATNDDKIIMHGFDTKISFRGKQR